MELCITQIKAIFIAGMKREAEDTSIEMGIIEEEDRKAPDFGDFMKEEFDIIIND